MFLLGLFLSQASWAAEQNPPAQPPQPPPVSQLRADIEILTVLVGLNLTRQQGEHIHKALVELGKYQRALEEREAKMLADLKEELLDLAKSLLFGQPLAPATMAKLNFRLNRYYQEQARDEARVQQQIQKVYRELTDQQRALLETEALRAERLRREREERRRRRQVIQQARELIEGWVRRVNDEEYQARKRQRASALARKAQTGGMGGSGTDLTEQLVRLFDDLRRLSDVQFNVHRPKLEQQLRQTLFPYRLSLQASPYLMSVREFEEMLRNPRTAVLLGEHLRYMLAEEGRSGS